MSAGNTHHRRGSIPMPAVQMPDGLEPEVLPPMQIGPLYIEFTPPDLNLSTMPPATMSPWWTALCTVVPVLCIIGIGAAVAWMEIESRPHKPD